ncbi:vesicle-associated protein 2-1 isoform X1 [Gossypium hirsutum]|uniref:Vesicle-associated protein 2-1 isoform X1 n=1 Tax=Gossypium hirsutum TaxID=3635 RepID=A0ABM3AQL5_GOSHI|nr:vesicle-associated protein 2-1-like isoform X1 [Gossypium hirsutum]
MPAGEDNQLISVHPSDLKFIIELGKQSFCDLKVVNNTENHVAFKVKTTSPKKYFVRPNTSVLQPGDSCLIRGTLLYTPIFPNDLISCRSTKPLMEFKRTVTLQVQREYPPDMQCKDKFLLQSTIVPPNTDVDDLPADTFNKESSKDIREFKLKVQYISPSAQGNSGDEGSSDSNSTLQQLKEDRDAAVRQTLHLQQELDLLKRRRQRRNDPGFSFKFAAIVGVIGIIVGLVLNLYLSK